MEFINNHAQVLQTFLFNCLNGIVKTILILIVAYILTRILRYMTKNLIYGVQKGKNISDQRIKTINALIDNLIRYTSGIITFVLILILAFGVPWASLAASVGIVGIIVGIGAQELISDTVNGFFVIFEGTYDIGEYIQIGEFEGYVIELGIKSTVLETFEYKKITIPNSKVQEVVNYSKNNYKLKYNFNVSYDEAVDTIEALVLKELLPTVKKLKDVKFVEYIGINEFKESSVEYSLLIDTDPEERFRVKRLVNVALKKLFDKEGIEIPYNNITISYKEE